MLLPGERAWAVRAALAVAAGYTASILIGFGLGWLKLEWLYLPLMGLALLAWLWRLIFGGWRPKRGGPRAAILPWLHTLWRSPAPWLLAS